MDDVVLFTIWFIKYYLPLMVANASPLLVKGSLRIDFSKNFIDGRPILGRNKTWEGFITGFYMGFSTTVVLSIVFNDLNLLWVAGIGVLMGLTGDLAGSFIKRRIGIESGNPLPVVDQLDFAIMGTIYYILIKAIDIRREYLFIVYAFVIIGVLHVITNRIAYILGLKDKKW